AWWQAGVIGASALVLTAFAVYRYVRVGSLLREYIAALHVARDVKPLSGFLRAVPGFTAEWPMTADSVLSAVSVAAASFGVAVGGGGLEVAAPLLAQGTVGDGLAILRRAVEAELRDLAVREGISGGRKGAGVLLRELERHSAIRPDLSQGLRYVIDVANRGVH